MKDCQAIQYSDQMQCARCGLAWDTNDPEPPACRPTADDREHGRRVLAKLKEKLRT